MREGAKESGEGAYCKKHPCSEVLGQLFVPLADRSFTLRVDVRGLRSNECKSNYTNGACCL